MTRKLVVLSALLLTLLVGAGAAFATEGEDATADNGGGFDTKGILYIASAFGMAFVSSVCAIAMGIAIKSFSEGVSRNPGASDKLQFGLILTLVLIETLALYVLAVLFVKVV